MEIALVHGGLGHDLAASNGRRSSMCITIHGCTRQYIHTQQDARLVGRASWHAFQQFMLPAFDVQLPVMRIAAAIKRASVHHDLSMHGACHLSISSGHMLASMQLR